jgi:hypothetical protein
MDQRIGTGLLQNQMNFDPGWEKELNDWLNYEHILELLHAPGIHGARRFVLVDDPAWGDAAVEGRFKWLTHYQLEDEGVLESPGYLAHRTHGGTVWTNRILNRYRLARTVYWQLFPTNGYLDADGRAHQDGGDGQRMPIGSALLHLAVNVEHDFDDDWNGWMNEQFLPQLLSLRGFVSARRFRKTPVPGGDLPGFDRDRQHEGEHNYLTVIELSDDAVLQSDAYLDMRANPSLEAQKLAPHYTFVRSVYRQIYPPKGACEDYDGIDAKAFEATAEWSPPLTGGL